MYVSSLSWRTPLADPEVECNKVGGLMESCLCHRGGPPPPGWLTPLWLAAPLAWHENVMDGWGARPLRWLSVLVLEAIAFWLRCARCSHVHENAGEVETMPCVKEKLYLIVRRPGRESYFSGRIRQAGGRAYVPWCRGVPGDSPRNDVALTV